MLVSECEFCGGDIVKINDQLKCKYCEKQPRKKNVQVVTEASNASTFAHIELLKKSTVMVRYMEPTKSGWRSSIGSGFICDKKGTIITNHHVIEPYLESTHQKKILEVGIRYENELRFEQVSVIKYDEKADLALLQLNNSQREYDCLKMTTKTDIEHTTDIWVAGYPLGITIESSFEKVNLTITKCSVTSTKSGNKKWEKFLQIFCGTVSGNSGGPVVDKNGEVLGIIQGAWNVSSAPWQEAEKAIHVQVIREFLGINHT